MIKNKSDLIEYLNEDKRIMNTNRRKPSLHQVCWKYLILLRKAEYYTNVNCVWGGGTEKMVPVPA